MTVRLATLALTAAALAAAPAWAQPLPVKLADGATWTLTARHTQELERGGQRTAWTVTNTSRLTWRRGEDGSGELRVEPLSAKAEPGGPADIETTQSLGVPVTLGVDETLTPQKIENLAEARAAFAKLIGLDAGRLAEAEAAAPGMADASITVLATREPALPAISQGSDLKLGQASVYEEQSANPLGGAPLLSHASYTLESYDAASGRAVIVWRRALDPKSAAASVAAAVEAMAARAAPDKADDARQALAGLKVDRNETCRHEIDVATGLAVKAECVMSASGGAGAGAFTRTDRWLVTQSLPQSAPKAN